MFGEQGGLIELLYAATGFLHVRREAYLRIQRDCQLPVCNEGFGHPLIAFFQPLTRPHHDGYWYLAEDYAFCHRARESGLRIMADASIRLWHIGERHSGWEDAGGEKQRQTTFILKLGERMKETRKAAITHDNLV
jgi:hypothetical protein